MAITRAQQVRQMLEDGGMLVQPSMTGKRPGYRGRAKDQKTTDAAYKSYDAAQAAANVGKASTAPDRDDSPQTDRIIDLAKRKKRQDLKDLATRQAEDKAQEPFETLIIKDSNLPGFLGMGLDALKGPRQFMLNKNVDYFRGLKSRGRLDAPRYSATAQGYKNYMADRLAGKIDATGNPLNQEDDDDQIFIPQGIMTAQEPEFMDQETDTDTDTEDQDERFLAFRADGGRIGFFTGMRAQEQKEKAASNREDRRASQYKSTTAKAPPSMGFGNPPPNVRDDRGGSDNQLSPKSGKFPSAVKQSAKELAPFVIGGPFGILSRSEKAKKAFDIINFMKGIGNIAFPEGDFQKIKATAPDQKTYNIKATKDLVENNPLGIVGEVFAPVTSFVTSPFYDGTQAFQRMEPGSGIKGFAKAFDAENPISSAFERAYGATLPLAERFTFEDGGPVGGIMDLESARQMYGLGKLVKKATRAVKKIAKSPIGKAALLYAGGSYLTGAGNFFGGLKGAGALSKAKLFGLPSVPNVPDFVSGGGTMGILGKLGLTAGGGSLMPTALGGIAAASALAGLLTAEQEEEAQELSRGEGIDIEAARQSILARAQGNIGGDLRMLSARASGGRIGYQEGSKEPVAKKTMPLLDMGGQEMDLRAEGGFVPIGRMEKADDVPARLSKNEFVFTADAVRNAGDGDVDKGAEVMYNMMKNLESGGDVSEESQGLEGARKMFQTSQRLEEVL